jgi:hypothetical protein
MKRDGKGEGFEDDGQEMMMTNTIGEQNIIKQKSKRQNMNA